ncbi:MBOAT family protein [Aureisphaera galaxeae]|uniref:MBOAT family O-acyltransferase n=1 Tax=Aureisphaera galaxeae TaxID=1538023 RepID=UPI00234FE7C2|nr:MBOAT family O-acyltransferase [Aureisphaera galaxeae]MDC8005887.1 MBOAT family protein [Aureisphaera galaxeae]
MPIVLAAYFISPKRLKTLILFLASLFFYAWGEQLLVIIMLTSAVVDFFAGQLIEKGFRKLGLGMSIATNLSLLGFFKYFNFTFDNFHAILDGFGYTGDFFDTLPTIALPIGISFYTFQTLSYTIDVYRGKVPANRNFVDFACYVTMFPQLVAGPIVRYADINDQLNNKEISFSNFHKGVERFIIGLSKKVFIANTFGAIADGIFAEDIGNLSTPMAWLGIVAYSFQIYFDFSGYSDMAIGLGRMFGFKFLENFNYPYISKSIKEFWRRWHISLSTWFRDYVYISLGGNRSGKYRTYVNLFIVFFVTGLWHGASWNFVVWGLFHGVFIVIERVGFDAWLSSRWKPIQHFYTLLVVIIGWVFFRAADLSTALLYLKKMFVYSSGEVSLNSYLAYHHLTPRTLFFVLVAVVFSMPVYKFLDDKVLPERIPLLRPVVFCSLFVLSIVYIGSETYNPFIYFRF